MISKTISITLIAVCPLTALGQSSDASKIIAEGETKGLKIEANIAFTEGPAWHAPSKSVFFTDFANNRIMRRDAKGALHIFRTPSDKANGLAFDSLNRLVACQSAYSRSITRTELDGTITVLADSYEGAKFNSPNDLVIDSKNRVYFTDPRYGGQEDMQIRSKDGTPVEGVYRIDPDGSVEQVLALEIQRPNGIALSRDEKFLFVADNPGGRISGANVLWRFDLKRNGSVDVSSQTKLFQWGDASHSRGPDGMCLGKDGNLYVTAGLNFSDKPNLAEIRFPSGIYVVDPNGKGLVNFIRSPIDDITNCTFGGEDGNTLFITAGHRLFSIRVE